MGLVRRTKTSVHKIVNVCLQYLSSLFYKNGVNSATIYPIIYNPPSYPLMKCWSSDSYHDEKWMIGYFWKLFLPEINVRMTNLAQFCQIWVILSTLWLLILLKKSKVSSGLNQSRKLIRSIIRQLNASFFLMKMCPPPHTHTQKNVQLKTITQLYTVFTKYFFFSINLPFFLNSE